jgi:hypothetical protein
MQQVGMHNNTQVVTSITPQQWAVEGNRLIREIKNLNNKINYVTSSGSKTVKYFTRSFTPTFIKVQENRGIIFKMMYIHEPQW